MLVSSNVTKQERTAEKQEKKQDARKAKGQQESQTKPAGAEGQIWDNTVQQTFKNLGSLKSVGEIEADRILKLNGFVFKGKTPMGYYKYYHPNGAKV